MAGAVAAVVVADDDDGGDGVAGGDDVWQIMGTMILMSGLYQQCPHRVSNVLSKDRVPHCLVSVLGF